MVPWVGVGLADTRRRTMNQWQHSSIAATHQDGTCRTCTTGMRVCVGKVLAIGTFAIESTEGRVLIAFAIFLQTKGALALAAKLVDTFRCRCNRWSW
jgi:hypothetical protein